jgi:hypothetical protein
MEKATKRPSVEAIVRHLDSGGKISNGAQSIYRVGKCNYFLTCEDGCCDTYLDEADLDRQLDADDWSILPNAQ